MTVIPRFPTKLHQDTADLVRSFFSDIPSVDTVLVVNSCARGQAVPESDLDFAILVKPGTKRAAVKIMENSWHVYLRTQPAFLAYQQSSQFAHLHVDIITGKYTPKKIERGEPIDYFEIEVGNHLCYSAPIGKAGFYLQELQSKWLPYYHEDLRLQRLEMVRDACNYDLDHIQVFVKRQLYFHAFDILCKAFQEYLQALFIANKTYPIAYNKWIKEQVVKWLNMPGLYPKLSPVLSVGNMESMGIDGSAIMLRKLLHDLPIK